MNKSDGALAEAIVEPVLVYVENHTKEFFDLSNSMTKEQFELWATYVGWEIYLSSKKNPRKDSEKYYKELIENCSLEQKYLVNKFYKSIQKAIANNEN